MPLFRLSDVDLMRDVARRHFARDFAPGTRVRARRPASEESPWSFTLWRSPQQNVVVGTFAPDDCAVVVAVLPEHDCSLQNYHPWAMLLFDSGACGWLHELDSLKILSPAGR
jgi:hypothetical protein